MQLAISPTKSLVFFTSVIFVLLLAHIAVSILRIHYGHGTILGFGPLFDLDQEQNIPTFFSSIVLLISSFLLLAISTTRSNNEKYRFHWLGLSLIFLFLSIDESAMIHERFFEVPTRRLLNASGLLFTAWIVPYSIITMTLVALYLRFAFQLPRDTRSAMAVAFGLYIIGAIGFEMLGGQQKEERGRENAKYVVFSSCEETLEMLGVTTLIFALLRHIERHRSPSSIVLHIRSL